MSGHPSTRGSRLPAPSSGIKPPRPNVGQPGKRPHNAITSSTSDVPSNLPKRPKSNSTKVYCYPNKLSPKNVIWQIEGLWFKFPPQTQY